MNERQKKVLIVVAVIVFGLLLYPPRQNSLGGYAHTTYGLIWDASLLSTVDAGLLITQWIGVLIVGGIAYLLFKDTSK